MFEEFDCSKLIKIKIYEYESFLKSWRWWMSTFFFLVLFVFLCSKKQWHISRKHTYFDGIQSEFVRTKMCSIIAIHWDFNPNDLGWCLSLTKYVNIMWKLVELIHLTDVKTSALEIVKRSFLKLDYRSCVDFYLW